MAIEILENTLLKLLVRRGTDADRKEITLESGDEIMFKYKLQPIDLD